MITYLIAIALQFATSSIAPTKSTVTTSSTQSVCDNGGWVDKDVKK